MLTETDFIGRVKALRRNPGFATMAGTEPFAIGVGATKYERIPHIAGLIQPGMVIMTRLEGGAVPGDPMAHWLMSQGVPEAEIPAECLPARFCVNGDEIPHKYSKLASKTADNDTYAKNNAGYFLKDGGNVIISSSLFPEVLQVPLAEFEATWKVSNEETVFDSEDQKLWFG